MRKLTAERWQRIAVVLDTALELSPELCPPFLDIACAGDPELRRGVERFLAVDAKLREHMANDAQPSDGEVTAAKADPLAGMIVEIERFRPVTLEFSDESRGSDSPPVKLLDRALNRLADLDERLARLILLRVASRPDEDADVHEVAASETDFRKASILLYEALREAT